MQHTFVQLKFVLSHGCIDSGFEWTKNVHGECLNPESKGNTLAQTAAKAAKMVSLEHAEGKGIGANKCDWNTT